MLGGTRCGQSFTRQTAVVQKKGGRAQTHELLGRETGGFFVEHATLDPLELRRVGGKKRNKNRLRNCVSGVAGARAARERKALKARRGRLSVALSDPWNGTVCS